MTSALIRRGKKRILVLYDSETFSAKQKMEGYERALSDAGYPVLGALKLRPKNEIHHARDLMLAYKNLEFDSVFAVEDGLAVAALKYAKVKGISVPEELSVVGYNNSPLSVSCEPELTSVDSRIEQQCYIAVENIVKVLEGNTEVSHRTIVPCEIVKRCTTDFRFNIVIKEKKRKLDKLKHNAIIDSSIRKYVDETSKMWKRFRERQPELPVLELP